MVSKAKEKRLAKREKLRAMQQLSTHVQKEKSEFDMGLNSTGGSAHSVEHQERQSQAQQSGIDVNALSSLFQL